MTHNKVVLVVCTGVQCVYEELCSTCKEARESERESESFWIPLRRGNPNGLGMQFMVCLFYAYSYFSCFNIYFNTELLFL